jgi:hypothetical protein
VAGSGPFYVIALDWGTGGRDGQCDALSDAELEREMVLIEGVPVVDASG